MAEVWLVKNFTLKTFAALFLFALLDSASAFAFLSTKEKDVEAPSVLKADEVDGDREKNILTATGNVEVVKGGSVFFADKIIYQKNDGMIKASGNIRARNIEVGKVLATSAEVKDDFSKGEFLNSKLFFEDGSYIFSPEIKRENFTKTTLQTPIYSVCPNPEISANNEIAGKKNDFAAIKSKYTVIDRQDDVMISKDASLQIYGIPVLYTPYLSVGLPSKKRKSGFLSPSYIRTSSIGLGLRIPYYFDIGPNMDLTTIPLISVSGSQVLLENQFRHLASYGLYSVNFELANNELKTTNNSAVFNKTDKDLRWRLKSEGKFDYTINTGVDFKLNLLGDQNYGRDYHFDFATNHTISHVNLDYIKGRNYYSAKIIKIQELENYNNKLAEPTILPIDAHVETKRGSGFFKEKFALTSNATTIIRADGIQYRRITAIPEMNLPFALNGNLFALNTKLQSDFYSIDNNSGIRDQDLKRTTQSNYKPEFSINWRLPLIRKSKESTFMIEPMANFVTSSYKKSFNSLINEDSNNNELTINNLFVADRIAGFDRNESGKRFNYGLKSSFFNRLGEFDLNIGQGYKSGGVQDVSISGFTSENKSNFVGQARYKAVKYLQLDYSFQLNQSNFDNEINQLNTTIDFDKFSINSSYLLIKKSAQNENKREQISFGSGVKLDKYWRMKLLMNKDLVTGRTLSRSANFERDGCCTTFIFSIAETNPSSLSKSQKSFNLNFQFKNL